MGSMMPLRMARSATTRRRTRQTTPAEYHAAFVTRVREARRALGWSQERMAKELDIPQDHYKHYEGRSIMPPHVLVKFCQITGLDSWFMLTGQSRTFAPKGTIDTIQTDGTGPDA